MEHWIAFRGHPRQQAKAIVPREEIGLKPRLLPRPVAPEVPDIRMTGLLLSPEAEPFEGVLVYWG